MALISPIHGQMSGKIGGNVFAANKGGQYVRQRRVPTNPGSVDQSNVRAVFAALATHWSSILTDAQREAWDQFAANVSVQNRVGMTIYLSGMNWFVHVNTLQFRVGGSLIDDAPSVYSLAAFNPIAVVYHTGTGDFEVEFTDTDQWVSEDGAFVFIQQGRPTSLATQFFKGPFRVCEGLAGDATTPPTSPQTGLTAPFPVSSDNKCFFRMTALLADGRPSAPTILEATVAV